MAVFYDTHAHLDYPDFEADFDAMIQRAQDAGVTRIICIGTHFDDSRKAIQLADKYSCIYAAVGWHPGNANEAPEDVKTEFRAMAQHPKVVAIGEIGLDYYRMPSHKPGGTAEQDEHYKANQARLFAQQLELAAELHLPAVIHQRSSMEAILEQMKPFAGRMRGVFHCYSENADALRRILEMDCMVSFTGILTFKNGQNVRDSLAAVPMGKFMLETDCPYLTPEPYRKTVRRCEPAFVKETATVAAGVKQCTLEELSMETCRAAHEFFGRMR